MSDFPAIFSTQDLKDDDAAVVDSYFIETDAPPDLKQAVEPIPVPDNPPAPLITRLISRELIIDPANSWAPTMLLPSDDNRKSIYIRVYSPTSIATDGIRIASNNGEVPFGAKVLHGNDWPVNYHTGAVWVNTTGAGANGVASAPVVIEYWSVTE